MTHPMRSLIKLCEATDMEPTISQIPGENALAFDGFGVHAVFERGAEGISIYEFSSHVRGGGRKALGWLKQEYGHIAVIDAGTEDDSLGFWRKMQAENLVDDLYDEDGQ